MKNSKEIDSQKIPSMVENFSTQKLSVDAVCTNNKTIVRVASHVFVFYAPQEELNLSCSLIAT